ncbi:hypothetical protein [Paracoccus contaminans]|uniref:Uncharacterized protein n=1 Tax=Paracoccus contaminans TaxID=1945662 RepID=A0A1W6CVU8_9RHOB|nr:hypothetical protein [Paracoccus contaminans]ARJ68976.1 hypothetical protein B0A89_04350 [Paracoccus contaminans]
MATLTHVAAEGARTTLRDDAGADVVHTPLAHDAGGIVGRWRGAMTCATSHGHLDAAWAGRTGARRAGGHDMLEGAEWAPASRPFSQIRPTPEPDGLAVHLPGEQL